MGCPDVLITVWNDGASTNFQQRSRRSESPRLSCVRPFEIEPRSRRIEMAYDGELVKMENGRWARFQRCRIANAGHQDSDEMSILVAVELDEHYQDLLTAAEGSLDAYRRRGIPVHV